MLNTLEIEISNISEIEGGGGLNKLLSHLDKGGEVTVTTTCAGETKALLLLQTVHSMLQEHYGEFGVLPHEVIQFGDKSATFYKNKEFAKM